MKQATAETEMKRLNISHKDDSSTNSNEYPDPNPKQVPLNGQYSDIDAKRQHFLSEHNLGKKKCETEYHQCSASFGMSVFNLGNAIMGSGILGLSYVMANTGIALFVEWYLNGDLLVLLVTFTIMLPLSLLRNLGDLGYTSGLSLLCMVFFLTVVIIKSFQIPCPLPEDADALNSLYTTSTHLNTTAVDHRENACTPEYFVFNSQTVYAVVPLIFSFMCHPTILPMYKELKDRSRRKMQGVANVSFLAVFIMYLLAALFGYLTFNVSVETDLLHTYSQVYESNVLLLIVRLAVLTAVTLAVPVVLFPVRTSINQLLYASKDFSWIRHTIITVILLAGINKLVIFVPAIRDIFGFLGTAAAAMLIFILPSSFYIKLVKKESMKSVQKIMATAFLLCGFVVMIGSISLVL